MALIRTIQVIDAFGHITNVNRDLASRTETITDFLGKLEAALVPAQVRRTARRAFHLPSPWPKVRSTLGGTPDFPVPQ
jgi:hypothetical protein